MEPNINGDHPLINQSLERLLELDKTMDSLKDIKMNSAYRGHIFTPQKRGLISYSLRGEWREKREQLRDVEKIFKETLDDLSQLLIKGAGNELQITPEQLNFLKSSVNILSKKIPEVKEGLENLKKEFTDDPGIATKASKIVNFTKFLNSFEELISSKTEEFKKIVDLVEINDDGHTVLKLSQDMNDLSSKVKGVSEKIHVVVLGLKNDRLCNSLVNVVKKTHTDWDVSLKEENTITDKPELPNDCDILIVGIRREPGRTIIRTTAHEDYSTFLEAKDPKSKSVDNTFLVLENPDWENRDGLIAPRDQGHTCDSEIPAPNVHSFWSEGHFWSYNPKFEQLTPDQNIKLDQAVARISLTRLILNFTNNL